MKCLFVVKKIDLCCSNCLPHTEKNPFPVAPSGERSSPIWFIPGLFPHRKPQTRSDKVTIRLIDAIIPRIYSGSSERERSRPFHPSS
jgi:hypothetical protein